MRVHVVAAVSVVALSAIAVGPRVLAIAKRDRLGSREACQRYSGLPAGFPDQRAAGMVLIRGGSFVPGSTKGYPDERPGGETRVEDFYIDRTEVTQAQFAAFVRATGYVTAAERQGEAAVFRAPASEEAGREYGWWHLVRGADYRHPEGPESRAQANEPVVQVAYEDALAYARWLGHALPSEAQWEFAARANRADEAMHHEPKDAQGRPSANFWQGSFPSRNTAEDGFAGRAPVGCFAENGFGLHDMVGNVWEWTADAYRGSHRDVAEHPEPAPIQANTPRVIKGGSYLCSADFCARYRVSARHRQEADMTGDHLGFRTVATIER